MHYLLPHNPVDSRFVYWINLASVRKWSCTQITELMFPQASLIAVVHDNLVNGDLQSMSTIYEETLWDIEDDIYA